jgi:serpin B
MVVPGYSQNIPEETVKGNNRFAFNLSKILNGSDQNVFFSPYSISSALAMTYTGAEGITKKEMSQALGFGSQKEILAQNHQRLSKHIDSIGKKKIILTLANSIWIQKKTKILKKFLNINKKYYKAGLKKVNFQKKHFRVRKKINRWVAKHTQKKIRNLIREGMISRSTRLVLANAIYFNGLWAHPFDKNETAKDIFYLNDGKEIRVPFMYQSLRTQYYEDELVRAIELPYNGFDLSMIIVLPRDTSGIKDLVNKMDDGLYQKYISSMSHTEVDVWFPVFKMETSYNLNDPLKKLGMQSAFDAGADFSSITGNKELFISSVAHQAFVEVNEEGTEAAAATAVVISKAAFVEKPEFRADHPFLFMIKDNWSDAILFMGELNHPEK